MRLYTWNYLSFHKFIVLDHRFSLNSMSTTTGLGFMTLQSREFSSFTELYGSRQWYVQFKSSLCIRYIQRSTKYTYIIYKLRTYVQNQYFFANGIGLSNHLWDVSGYGIFLIAVKPFIILTRNKKIQLKILCLQTLLYNI